MDQLLFYFNLGLQHVLDINAYDHVLYFIALTAPYAFKDWRRIIILVTAFTIGHTASLFLAVYQIVSVNSAIIECLIPITIFTTALFNVFSIKKGLNQYWLKIPFFISLFFGVIHGFGFSSYFKMIVEGSAYKATSLLAFALGIEASQIIVVLVVLILGFLIQAFSVLNKRDWILVMSSMVMGVVLPILKDTCFSL